MNNEDLNHVLNYLGNRVIIAPPPLDPYERGRKDTWLRFPPFPDASEYFLDIESRPTAEEKNRMLNMDLKSITSREALNALILQAGRQLAELERFPEDNFAPGTVLTWTRVLKRKEQSGSLGTYEFVEHEYRYVAVKASTGQWYTTSVTSSLQKVDYEKLCDMTDGSAVHVMNVGEQVIRARGERVEEKEEEEEVNGGETGGTAAA